MISRPNNLFVSGNGEQDVGESLFKLMRVYLLCIIADVVLSCKTALVQKTVSGNYSAEGKDYLYELNLQPDSSFTLVLKYFEVRSSCKGKYSFLTNSSILLKCTDEDAVSKLQRGYMTDRERVVQVIKRNRLRLGRWC